MELNLLKIARKPPLVVDVGDTVMKAVQMMGEAGVGAVAVTDQNKLVGIFTERDLLNRLIRERRSTIDTTLEEVMTRDPQTLPAQMEATEAFEWMTNKRYRYVPIVGQDNDVLGILSVRHLMNQIVENLSDELHGLSSYIMADGIGGG